MRIAKCLTFLPALLGAALFAASARGQVFADRVPADAIAYAGWAGTGAIGTDYDHSRLKGFIESLKLPQLFAARLQENLDQYQAGDEKDRAQLGMDLFSEMFKAPTAFYVGPVDFSDPTRPMPKIAAFSRIGKDKAGPLADRISTQIAKNPNPNPNEPPVKAAAIGDFLVVTVGQVDIEKTLSAEAPPAENLAATDGFKQAMAQVKLSANPAISLYIDGQAGMKAINAAVAAGTNAEARTLWPILADSLGLNAVKQLAWAGGFDSENWTNQYFLGLDQPRKGLAAMLTHDPLKPEIFKLIPRNATWAVVYRLDGPRLLEDVRDIAGKVRDGGTQQIDTLLQEAFAWTGIDIKNDLLPSLGDEFMFYTAPDAAGNSIRNYTMVNKLKSVEKATAVLNAAENLINLAAAQRDPNTKAQFHTENLPAPWDKVSAHVITLEGVSPAWAIQDGVLYISTSVAGLQNAIETGAGGKGSILDNPQFTALRKKIDHDAVSSFYFLDLPAIAPEGYEVVTQGLQLRKTLFPNEQSYTMPPLDQITPHLGPTLSVMWSDDQGLHGKEATPFPLARAFDPVFFLIMSLIPGQ